MTIPEIDLLTDEYYRTISFRNSKIPKLTDLKMLFIDDGKMINNSFAEPITFTSETYIKALETQISTGNLEQFMQREISAKTDVFGNIAQRVSVYEYTFAAHEAERLPKGVNFIQFIHVHGAWKINSIIWNDENESRIIPFEYLSFV